MGGHDVLYWRERHREVDFVVQTNRCLAAIEVKSGRSRAVRPGMTAFSAAFSPDRSLLVGGDGIDLEEFLSLPVESWVP